MLFKGLGLLVAVYTIYAALSGSVYAKSGPVGARRITRAQSPRYFWLVVACYAVLALVLLTIF